MSEDRLLTIGEAARQLKVSDQTLRAWERKGFIVPIKLPSGYRRYTQVEIDRLRREMGLLPGEAPAASESAG